LMVVATARPGVSPETLEEAVLAHLERAAASPPQPAEIERARNRLLTQYYSDLQKLDNRADLLSQFTTYFDDPGGVSKEGEIYREITGQELTDYAAGWFQESERVVVTFLPRNGQGAAG
jgi:zinc protease